MSHSKQIRSLKVVSKLTGNTFSMVKSNDFLGIMFFAPSIVHHPKVEGKLSPGNMIFSYLKLDIFKLRPFNNFNTF